MEPKSIAYNVDCLAYMKSLPDKAFDLAVVNPPYGGGARLRRPGAIRRALRPLPGQSAGPAGSGQPNTEKIIAWDNAPGKEYFDKHEERWTAYTAQLRMW